ncbi:hypothetical protein H920_02513 [Fukomys damarensis]|uniref:Uncharacterized protein n=1 Tax=Fukomys damarensis TaxID=885580 RepID=A0A091DVK4_FUKDA|nr:hypothetical protein H920_02513 [Fukomys damarensis]
MQPTFKSFITVLRSPTGEGAVDVCTTGLCDSGCPESPAHTRLGDPPGGPLPTDSCKSVCPSPSFLQQETTAQPEPSAARSARERASGCGRRTADCSPCSEAKREGTQGEAWTNETRRRQSESSPEMQKEYRERQEGRTCLSRKEETSPFSSYRRALTDRQDRRGHLSLCTAPVLSPDRCRLRWKPRLPEARFLKSAAPAPGKAAGRAPRSGRRWKRASRQSETGQATLPSQAFEFPSRHTGESSQDLVPGHTGPPEPCFSLPAR